jgi:hypothetical protein
VISPPVMFPSDRRRSQPHSCNASCNENGICEIETAPHSIEATFTGTHETFQYTKVCTAQFATFPDTRTMLILLTVYTRSVDFRQ